MLNNKLLNKHLNAVGYYQCTTTAGLWSHKWCPILLCFIVDNSGVKYVGERHAHHLCDTLIKHYEITQDWTVSHYASINIEWNYNKHTCRLSIMNYINNILIKWGHSIPRKPQLLPNCHNPITYGAKQQFSATPDTRPYLNETRIHRVQ